MDISGVGCNSHLTQDGRTDIGVAMFSGGGVSLGQLFLQKEDRPWGS